MFKKKMVFVVEELNFPDLRKDMNPHRKKNFKRYYMSERKRKF